jgi:hypothetical protein
MSSVTNHSQIKALATQVTVHTFLEFSAGAAIAAITAPFMLAGQAYEVAKKTVSVAVTNFTLRSLAALNTLRKKDPSSFSWFNWFVEESTVSNFLTLDSNRDTLVHELGHYCGYKAFMKGPVQMSIIPFKGGNTSLTYQGMSRLGNFLGKSVSYTLLTAAGPLFAMAASLACIAGAHFNQKVRPLFAKYLNYMAITSIAQHFLYALSAYSATSISHDFVVLAAFGISPLVSALTLLTIPILFKKHLNKKYVI